MPTHATTQFSSIHSWETGHCTAAQVIDALSLGTVPLGKPSSITSCYLGPFTTLLGWTTSLCNFKALWTVDQHWQVQHGLIGADGFNTKWVIIDVSGIHATDCAIWSALCCRWLFNCSSSEGVPRIIPERWNASSGTCHDLQAGVPSASQ